MADWSQVQNGLVSGFEIGQRTGGSGFGSIINKVAAKLQEDRKSQEALNLLGKTEEIKAKYANSGPKGMAEVEKEKAMANYYNSIAGQVSGGGALPSILGGDETSSMSSFGIPEEQAPDYYLKPRMVRNRGITSSVLFPERKKDLSQKTVDEISDLTSTMSDLNKNLKTQEEKNFNSGPGITTRSGAIADITAQFFRGPEFTSWKSDVGRAFQKYRKWATGVAAGYPELNMLAPNFPKTTDTPEVFRTKTLSAMDDMERNKQIFLDHLSKANYVVSQYKNIKKPSTSTQPDLSSMSNEELMRIAGE